MSSRRTRRNRGGDRRTGAACAIAIGALVACGRSSLDAYETGGASPFPTGSTGSTSNSTSTASIARQTASSISRGPIADAGSDRLDAAVDVAPPPALDAADDAIADGGSASVDAPVDGSSDTPPHPEVLQISAGGEAACALLSTGQVACWGHNGSGELGNGTTAQSSVPVLVSNVANVIALSVGPYSACALLVDGTVDCWGANLVGDNGSNASFVGSTAAPVPGLNNVVAISTGWDDACALIADGTVRCWGNVIGSPGVGGVLDDAGGYLPGTVPNLSGVRAISAGNAFACALMSDGTVQCWGANLEGELGNGTMAGSAVPAPVSNLDHVTAISTGVVDACALLSDGTVTCWGGDDSRDVVETGLPIPVAGLTGVVAVAPGQVHTCALLADQSVECWGSNFDDAIGGAESHGVRHLADSHFGSAAGSSHLHGFRVLLRPADGRRSGVLGRQYLRPARQRDDDHQRDAGACRLESRRRRGLVVAPPVAKGAGVAESETDVGKNLFESSNLVDVRVPRGAFGGARRRPSLRP